MIEYIREIDSAKWSGEQKNNIKQYKNVPGVWILLGKEKGNNRLICLQVARSVNIGGEIDRDISYLSAERLEPKKKVYVNQFGEKMFPYEEQPNRAQILYKTIAEKYENLIFVCVAHGEKLNDDNLRKSIEKYVAYKTLCPYWVNGGQYKEKDDEEIKSIKEACKEECKTLFEEIERNYQEGANSLNEFLNNLNRGNLDYLIPGKMDIPI